MKNLVLFLSMLTSLHSYSATNETASDAQLTNEYRTDSSFYRKDNALSITAELVGIGPSGVVGNGLNFGIYLSPSSLISLELHGGRTVNQDGLFWFGNSRTLEGYSAGVHYKKFIGNSFYFKGGADYRNLRYKYIVDEWFSSEETKSRFSAESTALGLAIGNQWQIKNFTLGCDWFGAQLPFSSRIYNEEYTSNADDYDYKRTRRDQKRYVTEVNYTLLRFYLGAAF